MTLGLSVLDQAPIRKGGTAAQAIAETLELAELCDRLGYRRYWLAEHHNTASLSCASPEILIGQVANRTRRIRVGSGGVMLSHYSPLKVAESFRMLETLFPGRIDLGIGRAPGSDRRTAQALAVGPGALGIEHYPAQIRDLLGFLEDDLDDDHPFRGIRAMPETRSSPELWILGSSAESAEFAAFFGCPYSFAHFITPTGGDHAIETYRRRFRPSRRLAGPRASLGVSAVCAGTQKEARRLSLSRALWWIKILRGAPEPFPSPEEAEAYPYDLNEAAIRDKILQRAIAGTPEQVRERLESLAAQHGVEEIVVLTITYDFEARKRSYELLADAFGLTPTGSD